MYCYISVGAVHDVAAVFDAEAVALCDVVPLLHSSSEDYVGKLFASCEGICSDPADPASERNALNGSASGKRLNAYCVEIISERQAFKGDAVIKSAVSDAGKRIGEDHLG